MMHMRETAMIRAREAAIAALPTEELRAAARVPDMEPIPTLLEPIVDTPPDYGFPEEVRIPYSERDDVETVEAAKPPPRKKKKLVRKKRKKAKGKRQQ